MRFRRFGLITFILSLCFSLPLTAEEKGGWVFDSLATAPGATTPDAQQVYQLLLKMLDRWNAHDIEGHLEVYWKSPELLVVVDSEQFNGWQQLHDSYLNGYPDRNAMGFINPALYSLGTSASRSSVFHDITSGSNPPTVGDGSGFNAVPGYDLVTGWGSPGGAALINQLAAPRAK